MTYQERYQTWLNSPRLSSQEREELLAIANDEKEIESRFFGPLEFGTAGLRGTMAVGLNRMNIHVIRHATQAFAQVILDEGPEQAARGVAICHDCRNHSRDFALAAAGVMAANGIPCRVVEAMRPTPELSFAVRHYGCIAGINVTASHNPKEYNGYKVYWSDGAQLPPDRAAAVAARMEQLDVLEGPRYLSWEEAQARGLITLMGSETDEAYLACVSAQANDPALMARVGDRFRMVYTPFHGAGYRLIPEVLHRLGVQQVICEPKQMVPDGNFSTVASPNPENPEGFYLAVELAEREQCDFILGSDPDADRVGILVRGPEGKFIPISGNQTGVLLLDYLIGARRRAGTLPEHPAALKTIVTTEMARRVAEQNGVACYDTFTGFKFMAQKKDALERAGQGHVIFSYEESYGYMIGDYVRDKDAVTASLLLTEMAAWYFEQGMTLWDALQALYEKYGWYSERTVNLVMPGLDGLAKRRALMAGLRAQPPAEIAGVPVVLRRDYSDGTALDTVTGKPVPMELAGSDVLRFELADGTHIVVRPSGTEPKIKVYVLASGTDRADCEGKAARFAQWAQALNG